MDHKVSKDMISSGMTPSGEKTQADLGRTQYGSAPSPNRLMDAYHSMYQNQKEETLDEKMGDAADFASRNIKGAKGASKPPTPKSTPKPETEVFQGNVVNSKTGESLRKASTIEKVRSGRKEVEDKKGITARREKVQGIMNKYGESVDLLAAYRSIYEHHQKDENGNTIPHEDDVKEGKIPAGLQAYLDKKKGKKKDDDGDEKKDKKDVKDSYDLVYNHFINEGFSEEETYERMSNLTEQQLDEFLSAVAKFGTGLFKGGKTLAKTTFNKTKNFANKAMTKVQNIAKPSGNSPKITSSGGKIEQSGNDKPRNNILSTDNLVKAQVVGSMLSGSGQQKQRSGNRTVSASADLFDIVKGQLLDEGLSEEEIRDIMLELTPEEILVETGLSADLLKRAAKGAEAARGKAAVAGNTELAKKKLAQSQKFSGAMKQKNLATSRAENMRKPTQYDSPVSRPQPDPTKPYPNTPR